MHRQQRLRLQQESGEGDSTMSDLPAGQPIGTDEEIYSTEDALKPVGSLSTTPSSSSAQSPIHLTEASMLAAQQRAASHQQHPPTQASATSPDANEAHASEANSSASAYQAPSQPPPAHSSAANSSGMQRSSSLSQQQSTPRAVSQPSRGQGSPSPHGLPRPVATATVS